MATRSANLIPLFHCGTACSFVVSVIDHQVTAVTLRLAVSVTVHASIPYQRDRARGTSGDGFAELGLLCRVRRLVILDDEVVIELEYRRGEVPAQPVPLAEIAVDLDPDQLATSPLPGAVRRWPGTGQGSWG